MATRKMKRARKVKDSKGKATVLKVDTAKKVSQLEKLLKSGKITIVLIYADWCGHCHRFKQNVWGPSCKRPAKHNRAEVNETVLEKTSLANANIRGYPSVIVVNEKGQVQNFKTPEGETTSAIPTPKSEEEMTRVANVDVNMPPSEVVAAPPMKQLPFLEPVKVSPPLLTVQASAGTPQGTTYEPKPTAAPPAPLEQKGGNMMTMLEGVTEKGILPPAVLKAISSVMSGGKRSSRRKTQKRRRFIRA